MTAPTKFTQLLDFVSGHMTSLSDTPTPDELSEFCNGCHDNFVATHGEDTDTRSSSALMRTLVHLSPIVVMEEAFTAAGELEKEHRILTASDFSRTVLARGANAASISVEPLEKLAFATAKYNNNAVTLPGYGQHIPADLRPFVVAATLKLCCIFSSLWGFYLAYNEPTMDQLHKVIDYFAKLRTPKNTADMHGTICTRSGLLLGWNCAMHAVDEEFTARQEVLTASTPDMALLVTIMQSVCRRALKDTAEGFSQAVEEWKFGGQITFDTLDLSFDSLFQRIIGDVAAPPQNEEQLRFSLRIDTTSVRRTRSLPSPARMQLAPRHGRIFASVILNVPEKVVEVIGMQPVEKRRRLNVSDPPQVTAPEPETQPDPSTQPPPPPPPLTEAQIAQNAAVERERRKMAADLRRRRDNRIRNRTYNPGVIWDEYKFNIRAVRSILDGRQASQYENDDPDSENEEIEHEQERAETARRAGDVEERISVEKFMLFVVNLHMDPFTRPHHRCEDSFIKCYGQIFNWLLPVYLRVNYECFLYEATRALNSSQYADHLKAMLHLETNFQLQSAIYHAFPELHAQRDTVVIHKELTERGRRDQRYFVVRVERKAQSRSLIELITEPFSESHNVRRSLIKAFPGQTVCAALMFKRRARTRPSRLSLMICRGISHHSAHTAPIDVNDNPQLDDVTIRLTASRYHLDSFDIQPDDIIHLIPICSIVSHLRELKSLHAVTVLPRQINDILFGASFRDIPRLPETDYPSSAQELATSQEPLDTLRARCNPGCLEYVDSLPDNICDNSQRRAVVTACAEMGELRPNSASMSLIVGPPGCGKSSTIAVLCMTIFHHSIAGHRLPDAQYPTVLPKPRPEFRCSNNPDGVSILITCPSNVAVDEVVWYARKGGPTFAAGGSGVHVSP